MRRRPQQIHPSNAPGRLSPSRSSARGVRAAQDLYPHAERARHSSAWGAMWNDLTVRASRLRSIRTPRGPVGKQGTRKPSQAVDVNETQKRASTPPRLRCATGGAGTRTGAWMTAAYVLRPSLDPDPDILYTKGNCTRRPPKNGAPCANGGE
ncbi:hypothetical protein B0H14DRAFT_2781244 [Mycena olivaceomarginata]|nr:hypothetical protein B0H14DRAFT_2781244 [Mycena olivaceomarginata]